jgi:hypothetical protein
VRPLEDIGAALQVGKSYRLVISSDWKDGAGMPLKESFEKPFQVGHADRDTPNPEAWKVESPKSATLVPLVVRFPEPMDNAVTQRVIQVLDDAGKLIEGKVALDSEERRWIFVPEKPWQRGAYRLGIQTTIEDLAGNNIGKPFDVDTFEQGQRRTASTIVNLPFKID